jgi:hypothetical protein
MKQVETREGARRQHRVLGTFALLQCWRRGLDGIVVDREHLQRIIGLEKFKEVRIEWLLEDLEDCFPHRKNLIYTGSANKLASLYLSRKSLDGYFVDGSMEDEERVELIQRRGGPKLGLLRMWDEVDRDDLEFDQKLAPLAEHINSDEALLTSYLTIFAQGQIPLSAFDSIWE